MADLAETLTWTLVNTEVKFNRLSHTSTQVGSYLFIIGGHSGQTYAQDILLFNLSTSIPSNHAEYSHASVGAKDAKGATSAWEGISRCAITRFAHIHLGRL